MGRRAVAAEDQPRLLLHEPGHGQRPRYVQRLTRLHDLDRAAEGRQLFAARRPHGVGELEAVLRERRIERPWDDAEREVRLVCREHLDRVLPLVAVEEERAEERLRPHVVQEGEQRGVVLRAAGLFHEMRGPRLAVHVELGLPDLGGAAVAGVREPAVALHRVGPGHELARDHLGLVSIKPRFGQAHLERRDEVRAGHGLALIHLALGLAKRIADGVAFALVVLGAAQAGVGVEIAERVQPRVIVPAETRLARPEVAAALPRALVREAVDQGHAGQLVGGVAHVVHGHRQEDLVAEVLALVLEARLGELAGGLVVALVLEPLAAEGQLVPDFDVEARVGGALGPEELLRVPAERGHIGHPAVERFPGGGIGLAVGEMLERDRGVFEGVKLQPPGLHRLLERGGKPAPPVGLIGGHD